MRNKEIKTTVVNAESGLGTGLGDCVCLCWLPNCIFYVKSQIKKDIFSLFGQKTTDDITNAKTMLKSFQRDLSAMDKRSRLVSWRRGLRIRETHRRPPLILTDEAKKFASIIKQQYSNYVMLFPLSKVVSRIWPANYWIDLAWKLKDKGVHVFTYLPEPNKQFRDMPNLWTGFDFQRIAALMQQAKLVIGNDSFPAHLSSTIGTKTLVMGGPTNGSVYEHYGETTEIVKTKRVPCVGCCFKPPFRQACHEGCFALYGLFPDDVFDVAISNL